MGLAEQAAIEGLQARLQGAVVGFQAINEHCEVGNQYSPPLGWDLSASVAALVEVLIEAGVISNEQFVLRALTNQVAVLEDSLREAAEDLRKRTGVIVPIGLAGRGQG